MREAGPAENLESLEQTGTTSPTGLTQQGTQKFGGVRVGNGPTEDEAEIIEHDQLSQHSEEGDEVSGIQDCESLPWRPGADESAPLRHQASDSVPTLSSFHLLLHSHSNHIQNQIKIKKTCSFALTGSNSGDGLVLPDREQGLSFFTVKVHPHAEVHTYKSKEKSVISGLSGTIVFERGRGQSQSPHRGQQLGRP